MKIIKLILRIFFIGLGLYSLANILGLRVLWIDAYIFNQVASSLITVAIIAVVVGGFLVYIYYYGIKKNQNKTITPIVEPHPNSTVDIIVAVLRDWPIYVITLSLYFYPHLNTTRYDLIYAYGTPQAIEQISV